MVLSNAILHGQRGRNRSSIVAWTRRRRREHRVFMNGFSVDETQLLPGQFWQFFRGYFRPGLRTKTFSTFRSF